MKVELEKEDLISLVLGSKPQYQKSHSEYFMKYGEYKTVDGYYKDYKWKPSAIIKLTEVELWELYNECKKSWKIK